MTVAMAWLIPGLALALAVPEQAVQVDSPQTTVDSEPEEALQPLSTSPKAAPRDLSRRWIKNTALHKILHPMMEKEGGATSSNSAASCTLSSNDVGKFVEPSYMCSDLEEKGLGVSPRLEWELEEVSQTDRLAIFLLGNPANVDNHDLPNAVGGLVHWAVYDVPASIALLHRKTEEDLEKPSLLVPDAGGVDVDAAGSVIRQAKNSYGRFAYAGPCPPANYTSNYVFKMVVYPAAVQPLLEANPSWESVAEKVAASGIEAECQFVTQCSAGMRPVVDETQAAAAFPTTTHMHLSNHTYIGAPVARTKKLPVRKPKDLLPEAKNWMIKTKVDLEDMPTPHMLEGVQQLEDIESVGVGTVMADEVVSKDANSMVGMSTEQVYDE